MRRTELIRYSTEKMVKQTEKKHTRMTKWEISYR